MSDEMTGSAAAIASPIEYGKPSSRDELTKMSAAAKSTPTSSRGPTTSSQPAVLGPRNVSIREESPTSRTVELAGLTERPRSLDEHIGPLGVRRPRESERDRLAGVQLERRPRLLTAREVIEAAHVDPVQDGADLALREAPRSCEPVDLVGHREDAVAETAQRSDLTVFVARERMVGARPKRPECMCHTETAPRRRAVRPDSRSQCEK